MKPDGARRILQESEKTAYGSMGRHVMVRTACYVVLLDVEHFSCFLLVQGESLVLVSRQQPQ